MVGLVVGMEEGVVVGVRVGKEVGFVVGKVEGVEVGADVGLAQASKKKGLNLLKVCYTSGQKWAMWKDLRLLGF